MTTYTGESTSTTPGVSSDSDYSSVPSVSAVHSAGGNGVYASSSGVAVYATSSTDNLGYGAIYAQGTGEGPALYATGEIGVAAFGGPIGLHAAGTLNGVEGMALSTNGAGVFAHDGFYSGALALQTRGSADIVGTLTKSSGSFRIDHPLRPTEQYLNHAFVESSDHKNIYDGIATADENGEATIALPDWFEALNEHFRYQLTALGRPAPGLHVAAEVAGGCFRFGGASAGQRVSWQVTGVRRDPYARAHPVVVVEDKPIGERGTYRHPEVYAQGSESASPRLRPHPLPTAPGKP